MTIFTDSLGNKYIGYNGNLVDGFHTSDQLWAWGDNSVTIKELIEAFPNNITETDLDNGYPISIIWNTNGNTPNGNISNGLSDLGNGTYGISSRSNIFAYDASDLSQINIYSSPEIADFLAYNWYKSLNNGVAQIPSTGEGIGTFTWSNENNYTFLWFGLVENPNISEPQSRCVILVDVRSGTTNYQISMGVKQADSTTKRVHLSTQSGANHSIDCGTDTADLFLIEDDGAGGDGGTAGKCPNLYLSKKPSLSVGNIVRLNGIADGGSEQAIVAADWGDSGKILMRVYDGVN